MKRRWIERMLIAMFLVTALGAAPIYDYAGDNFVLIILYYPLAGFLVAAAFFWFLWKCVEDLNKRQFASAARFLGVLLLGIGVFYVGGPMGDFIVFTQIDPVIQSAIRDVRAGKQLPPDSMLIFRPEAPDLAAFVYASDPWATEYIVYDKRDRTLAIAAPHIDRFLNRGCDLRIREIAASYYLVRSC